MFIIARNSVVVRFDVTDAQANALIAALRRPAAPPRRRNRVSARRNSAATLFRPISGASADGYFDVASACFSPFGGAPEHSPHFGGASQIVDRSWLA